ncbi:putative Predicted protein [groundwater metagenome]|uniref:ATPase domain-containing protein n=1 Tax=groundwater metagenome TaxID=717931 RepID=A0A098EC90_9ZZZZ
MIKLFRYNSLDVEWIREPQDFVAEILVELSNDKEMRDKMRKFVPGKFSFLKLIEEIGIATFKVKLREELSKEWENKGKEIFEAIESSDIKIVFIIDEFPVMIHEMCEKDKNVVKTLLHWMRQVRQNSQNVMFVVGGSIGIDRILSKIDAFHTINDLTKISVGAFDKVTARNFVSELFKSENIEINEEITDKILEISRTYIPYFIQLVVYETVKESQNQKCEISKDFVEKIYEEKVLGVECRTYFEDYYQRLRRYYEPIEEKDAKEILKGLAMNEYIGKKELYNFYLSLNQTSKNPEEEFSLLMGDLENDFYVKFDYENDSYSFYSKVLKDWWKRYYLLTE